MFVKLDPDGDEITRPASAASTAISRTPARLYVYDTILRRLTQDIEDMAPALGEPIEEAHAVVGQ
jgi:hypothetical protein